MVIVLVTSRVTIEQEKIDKNQQYRNIKVFVKKLEQWQCVAWQVTSVDPKAV